MQFHDVANIFPLLDGEGYRALVDDIRGNGQREPIWTHQGEIIDGRNRYRACQEIGISPITREWSGQGSLVGFVVSLNLHRRHLTPSQKAAISPEINERLSIEAKERQSHGMTAPGKTLTEKIPEAFKGEAREQTAKVLGINPHYVSDAKLIKEKAPELIEKVKQGELTITQAKRQIVKNEVKEAPKIQGKYRIIYADPPWKYNNKMPEGTTVPEDYYPAMSLQEICNMPVKELAENNAVLFLWATSPLLEESFNVIKAWGFNYKTSFVWDKVKHNMGHYNSVRHEFLLVGVRGSCMPDVPKLFNSVYSEERTTHSKKPEYFRKVIDTIYPYGNRIELFARKRVQGWDSYGNQLPEANIS